MDRSFRLISPLERAFHVKKVGGLRDIPPADLASLALLAQEHSFARGEALCRSGERVKKVHIVVDGLVRVRGGEHGDVVVGAGDGVGMLSLLARADNGLDAVAESDTVTLSLRAGDLFDAFETDFGLLYSQIRYLATETLRLRKRIPAGTYLAPDSNRGETPVGDIGLVPRLLYMRRGVLRNGNMDALMTMAQRMHADRFEPGTTLWRIGEPSGFMQLLLDGRVRCATEDGTEFTCGPGYPLGNLESQCSAPRWYDAVTETAVTALRNDIDAFLDIIEQHFDMAVDFVGVMAKGLIERRAEMRQETQT